MTTLRYQPVDMTTLDDRELAALADWHRTCAERAVAEQTRRATRKRHRAAYRLADGVDDPRWTPQSYDGIRLIAGEHRGFRGFVRGLCDCPDRCSTDERPRWQVYSFVLGLLITCVPRTYLRPIPTVRRPGDLGRARCNYQCSCCAADLSRRAEAEEN